MVEALREIFSKKYNLEKCKLSFLKLYHAGDAPSSKILFFVFYSGKTLGVIKIIRDAEYNASLQHECDAQIKASEEKIMNVSVPKIIDSGFVGKHFFTYETFVFGEAVGKKNALKYIDVIGAYQSSVTKKKKIAISAIHQIFSSVEIKNEKYQSLLQELSNQTEHVFGGTNHSDLTFMNVLVDNKDIYFIDWENYGERAIWGLDFVHYFIRAHDNHSYDILSQHFKTLEIKPMTRDELAILYLVDKLYDFLEKSDTVLYKEVCKKISDIC